MTELEKLCNFLNSIKHTEKRLLVLVGKSGSGKTALSEYISENFRYEKIVSHTTRPIRNNEVDEVDYFFVSDDKFTEMKLNNEFVETTSYRGWGYGISYKELENEQFAIVVTDVNGLRNLKRKNIPLVSFFINRDDKSRFISSIERGDNIMEIALRNERDTACYQDIKNEVDFVIENNYGIEELGTRLLSCIGTKNDA